MTRTLVLARPDDWHVHLRDGDMLKAVLPYTAHQFGRAIVMPNLKNPVITTALAAGYRQEISESLPPHSDFKPLMTVYLTDDSDAEDIRQGFAQGVLTAAKLYPAHATTNSAHGVTDLKRIYPVLEAMQAIGMPLLVHGEVTDPEVDIFDREAVFIERILQPLRAQFPALKVVLEHITTSDAVDYIMAEGKGQALAATITAHHLLINRNAVFKGGICPHYYCLPIAKRERHRLALVKAAISGLPYFFLGTDTAPHLRGAKEGACGCAGVFTAPYAIELYAQAFDDAGAIEKLGDFASVFGPAFYGLPVNAGTLEIERLAEPPQNIKSILTANGGEIVVFAPPQPLRWRLNRQ